ncbi:unnamed protein product [Phaeothamnion confervicola]
MPAAAADDQSLAATAYAGAVLLALACGGAALMSEQRKEVMWALRLIAGIAEAATSTGSSSKGAGGAAAAAGGGGVSDADATAGNVRLFWGVSDEMMDRLVELINIPRIGRDALLPDDGPVVAAGVGGGSGHAVGQGARTLALSDAGVDIEIRLSALRVLAAGTHAGGADFCRRFGMATDGVHVLWALVAGSPAALAALANAAAAAADPGAAYSHQQAATLTAQQAVSVLSRLCAVPALQPQFHAAQDRFLAHATQSNPFAADLFFNRLRPVFGMAI